MKSCPSCGAANAPEARYCGSCGAVLADACAQCGHALPAGARFCPACGAPVAEPDPSHERKLVTVLFADVTGYTSLGERLDAEGLKEVMDAYFAAMREAIEAEGGTVEKFIGDAVMAVFGVPTAHEDDPARALRAALGMQARLAKLNESLTPTRNVTLEMRIGVNSGEVMAVAEPRPGVGMVTGDAVNVAARLEQNAEPGQVLVSERVARAVRGFSFADVGPLTLKGKGHQVRALRLVDQIRTPERGIPGLRAPLIGRDSEMALLDTLYQRVVAEGRPHLVTVYGDAGVGKSRLVTEFVHRVEQRDPSPLILSGRCLPYGEGITYWPLAEILKGLAGTLDTDPPDLVIEKIRKLGRELLTPDVAPDPARSTAALAYTVGVEDPDVHFRDLSPRQVRLETHTAWRSFFTALASERPVVVLVEDIHWADTALLDLLEELADRLSAPVLLVCPARPELTERRSAWGGGKRNFSSIFLDPLTREEADRLVGFLLAVANLPNDARARILERAEGNPFFLEEILRQLIDEGRIVRDADGWRATAGCDEIVIPDTVQGVLAARIDLLAPDEKRVAQAAAVVGRVFWTGPLRRLAGDEIADVDDILDRLEGRELIRARLSSSIGGDREYIFKHVLTRDVAYESLPRRDRATAHARVAAWLEETAGERRLEFAQLLAHHFLEAFRAAEQHGSAGTTALEDLRTKASEYLLLAAGDARTKFVLGTALKLSEDALTLARDPLDRSQALEVLGATYVNSYRGDLGWRHLREAVDERLRGAPDDHAAIARLCARALEVPCRWPGSMHALPPESEAARYLALGLDHVAHDPEGEGLARLLMMKAFWPNGYPETDITDGEADPFEEDGRRAAELARGLGLPELESAALDAYGSVFIARGQYGAMRPALQRRLQLAETVIRDPWELGDTFSVAAWAEFMIGDYRQSLAYAVEGLNRMSVEVVGLTMHCLAWGALSRWMLGDWSGFSADLKKIEDILGDQGTDPPHFASRPFVVGALIDEIRGNEAGAAAKLAVIERMQASQAEWQGGVTWFPWRSRIQARRGQGREALERFAAIRDDARARAQKGALLEARCDVVAEAGAWDQAAAVVAEARAFAEVAGLVALPVYADRLEGLAALAAGDVEAAGVPLARAATGFAALGAIWEEAVTNLSLADVLGRMGKPTDAQTLLGRAADVFEELGSPREHARARELFTSM